MNLWSMDEDGHDLKQHTRHHGWDVTSPSLSDGRIVYQLGADLRVYDIAAAKDEPLPIRSSRTSTRCGRRGCRRPWST